MKAMRKIVHIDEEKCDGCGNCVPSCVEGALKIIDGKARLVSEVYCDGLGACLGECPNGAISVEEREADEFDEKAVEKFLKEQKAEGKEDNLPCGCPGTLSRIIERGNINQETCSCSAPCEETEGVIESRLTNWPVQLNLAPVSAPYFQNARLLIAADCVPFAFADFHRKFVDGRIVLMGCSKLDDAEHYRRKLTQIFLQNDIESILLPYMEVPCCSGMVSLVEKAVKDSGKKIPITLTKIAVNGDVLETEEVK